MIHLSRSSSSCWSYSSLKVIPRSLWSGSLHIIIASFIFKSWFNFIIIPIIRLLVSLLVVLCQNFIIFSPFNCGCKHFLWRSGIRVCIWSKLNLLRDFIWINHSVIRVCCFVVLIRSLDKTTAVIIIIKKVRVINWWCSLVLLLYIHIILILILSSRSCFRSTSNISALCIWWKKAPSVEQLIQIYIF